MSENNNIENFTPDLQELNRILKVKAEKLSNLKEMGKNPFLINKFDVTNHSSDIQENFTAFENKTVTIAGRMMSKRVMGKASFCNIADLKGNIQCYVARDAIGIDNYTDFKKYDIGDILGLRGDVFKTKTGEISIHVSKITLLCKSLQILPEKFHGLTNTDLRYRQRYVDLIVNPTVKDTFVARSKIIKEIRNYLDEKDFMEVETPILTSNAGGANARTFDTHFNALNEDLHLRISLELYLKRLIVGGLEKVYEIGRVFRNEGTDTKHNPEFTLMELYQAYTDYNGMMNLAEDMIRTLAKKVCGTTKLPYGDLIIDVGEPFKKITMIDAIKEYAGVDFNEILTDEDAKIAAKQHNIEFEERYKRGDILSLFFEEYAEKHLIQPTFVIDHPVEISPLTKKRLDNPSLVERFELFINGNEIANAYSEINDPIDQRQRFEFQEALRQMGDDEANRIDEDFLNALMVGMPPTGGIGFGIDRLIMLFTNSQAIRDVLLFPTMKSLDKEVTKIKDISNETCKNNDEIMMEKIDFSKVKVEPLFEDMVDFDTFSKSDFRVVKVKECVAVPKSKKLLQFTLDDGSGENRTILSGIHSFYEPEELVGKTLLAITNLPPRKMMGVESCGMLLSAICEYNNEELLNLIILDDNIPAGAKIY